MPANKNAMTRYKILDELLSNRYHNFSLDDLTEEVSRKLSEIYPNTNGIVRRTIEKDIFYLEYEGPFMVDIDRYSVSGYSIEKQRTYTKQCLRYRNPGFSIFKKDLSNDEEYLLREAMSLLGQFDGLPNLEALQSLRLGLGVKTNERKIISFAKNPLENSNLIGELFTSISQKQVITIHYHSFENSDQELTVNVHPYLLKEYNRRWYLIASAELDNKILTFGLERIVKIVPQPSHKYIEYKGDIEEFYDDIIGVTNYDDSKVERIVFWVSEKSKKYVETKPLHGSQINYDCEYCATLRTQYPSLIKGSFFSIDCKKNYELIRELTSFGKELLVLSPDYIRKEVIQIISDVKEEYDKLHKSNS